MTVPIRRLSALSFAISLGIVLGLNTSFADTLSPATGFIYATGKHDSNPCAGACVLTPGSGELSYDKSGGGGEGNGAYSWAETASVNENLGPGAPLVGAVHVTGHAATSGKVPQNQASSGAGGSITAYVSVDQIKVPTFNPIVLPIYFEAKGEGSDTGSGSFGAFATLFANKTVAYKIQHDGSPGSDSFNELTTVDASPNTAYSIEISAGGGAFADWTPGVGTYSSFDVAVDPKIGFDQAAFDALYGSNSFPLAQYYSIDFSPNVPVPSVPVPGALPLFASGLAGLGLLGWRRKRKAYKSCEGSAL